MLNYLITAKVVFREPNESWRESFHFVIMILYEIESFPHSLKQWVVRYNGNIVASSLSGIVPIRKTIVFSTSDGTDLTAESQSQRLMPATDSDDGNLHFLNNDFQSFEKIVELSAIFSLIFAPRYPVGAQGQKRRLPGCHVFNRDLIIREHDTFTLGTETCENVPDFFRLARGFSGEKIDYDPRACGRRTRRYEFRLKFAQDFGF
jgi:hypothetical protein